MPALTSISTVGDKLIVGQIDTSFLTATGRVAPGTAVLNGPVYIGATPSVGVARATCMIGPPLPGLTVPASLEVMGITNIIGFLNVTAISLFTGVCTKNALTLKNALSLKNAVSLSNTVNIGNGPKINNAPLIVNSFAQIEGACTASIMLAGDFVSATTTLEATHKIALTKKPFDILHPTKKDHRLRYVCLEGPAAEVYIRGYLDGSNSIELPDYWKGLIHMNTIGVHLTPIRMHQELFVDRIENENTIYIKNNSGGRIKCYYTVTAERKDVAKNIPEYKGLTPEDYPGDNREYRL
jgi:hypothetical protein